ncbi:MAG: LOG family protein, partial [Burkholderiales bacterium]
MNQVICEFGNSSPAVGSPDYQEARVLGELLARAGFAVCSGGYYGAMEAVSRGAREAGGYVMGMTTPFYRLAPNAYLHETIEIPRWQDRLFALVEKGAGYVVLRGGTGTLLELAALWECLNKRAIAARPCVAMEFWRPVIEAVRAVEQERRGRTWDESAGGLIRLAATP